MSSSFNVHGSPRARPPVDRAHRDGHVHRVRVRDGAVPAAPPRATAGRCLRRRRERRGGRELRRGRCEGVLPRE